MTTKRTTRKTENGAGTEAVIEAPTTVTTDIVTFLRVLWSNSWVIILVTIIGAVASFVFVRSQTPIYESYTSLIVSPRVNIDQGRTLEGIRVLQQNVVGTYVQILSSGSVRRAAIESLQDTYMLALLEDAEVDVRPIENSTVMMVSVRSESPELARDLVDAIAEDVVRNNPVPSLIQAYPLQILDPAMLPERPLTPQGSINIVLGVAGSLVIGVGLAFLIEEFQKKRRAA